MLEELKAPKRKDENMRIVKSERLKPKVPESQLSFGTTFSDHMFVVDFATKRGWYGARVEPYGPMRLEPAAAVLHYGQAMFEGMKAFRDPKGKVNFFRPEDHFRRIERGAPRLCMTTPPVELMMDGLQELVRLDEAWVPSGDGMALYIRPTLVAVESFLGLRAADELRFFIFTSPTGNYYGTAELVAQRIWIESKEVRAASGGLGGIKAAANYAASLHAATAAKKRGYAQVLWLDARDHEFLQEVGTMNVFVVLDGALVTPPVSDTILGGVTRESILTIARDMGMHVEERPISVKELRTAQVAGRFSEAFGTGTAAVVAPVNEFCVAGEALPVGNGAVGPVSKKLYLELSGIQRGTRPDKYGWLVPLKAG